MSYPFKSNVKDVHASEFDPNEYDSFIVSPDKLDDQIIFSLVDLFSNKISAINNDIQTTSDLGGPNIQDKIMSSIAVGYITKDGEVVAGCTIQDPTVVDYHGNIPSDHYEMMTGISLEGRVEQEYFIIHPDFHDIGLSAELRRLINTVVEKTFIIVAQNDIATIEGLSKARYQNVCSFLDIDSDNYSELWIN